MQSDPVDMLLEKLSIGDEAAAEEVFRTYEPFLRIVIRRQLSPRLQAKFDSMDVVQSLWADLVNGFRRGQWQFSNANQLRAFLVTAARNRFSDRYRTHRLSLDREQPLVPNDAQDIYASGQPSPSEVVQANDIWERLLELCPPEHKPILELKRQGASNADIIAQTGMHEGSLRRILRVLSRKLARDQQRSKDQ